jgi:hypothetical protein
MTSFISKGRNFFAEIRHRLDRVAEDIFDNAVTPERRHHAARDEFTADFTARLDTERRDQYSHRNRRIHADW